MWYYKMYYLLINPLVSPFDEYRIFIDVKDTKGGPRINKLQDVLCNNIYDFKQEVIKDIKQIQSHESEVLQLVDLINGALSFVHRGLYNTMNSSEGKRILIDSIIREHGATLEYSTPKNEHKLNVFVWKPKEGCK